ncbi:MAG: transporter, partial [Bacteroidota bacterium]
RWVMEPVTTSGNGAPTTRGLLPMEFGFKSKLWDADDGSSALSFIAHLQMPHLASSAFRGTRVGPLARFTVDKELAADWRVGANAGLQWDAGGGPATAIYTLAAGSSLSESMGWYGEVYGFFPMEQLPADHRVNGGITYLLNEDLQLDAAVGVGLSSTPAPWFIGVGVSYRFAVIR